MTTKNDTNFTINFALTAGYGALIALGGIIGFVKKGSKASLLAGGLFGTAIMLSSTLLFKGEVNGLLVSSLFTGILSAAMGSRYLKNKGNMNAAIAIGGAGITAVNLYSYYSLSMKK